MTCVRCPLCGVRTFGLGGSRRRGEAGHFLKLKCDEHDVAQKLVASNGTANGRFGTSVAIAAEGYAIVGEDKENQVYLYERQPEGTWLEVENFKLCGEGTSPTGGTSVSISGGRAVSGGQAVACVFERQPGGGWIAVQKLTPTENSSGFGESVSISGERILVGAASATHPGVSGEAAIVFERRPDGIWTEVTHLTASDPGYGYQYGLSVSLSGAYGIVGARKNGTGAVYVLEAKAQARGDRPDLSLGAGGTLNLALDAGAHNAGRTYLMLGSLTGLSPGLVFGDYTLPLNADGYFLTTLANPNVPPLSSSLGSLDADGRAAAAFDLPPGTAPSLAGVVLGHAFAVLDTGGAQPHVVSNPVPCTFVP